MGLNFIKEELPNHQMAPRDMLVGAVMVKSQMLTPAAAAAEEVVPEQIILAAIVVPEVPRQAMEATKAEAVAPRIAMRLMVAEQPVLLEMVVQGEQALLAGAGPAVTASTVQLAQIIMAQVEQEGMAEQAETIMEVDLEGLALAVVEMAEQED